jgi:hypothetical protein
MFISAASLYSLACPHPQVRLAPCHSRHRSPCQALVGDAYFRVHSLAVSMAAFSLSFQLLATSAASGSSGFGAPSRAWMESNIVRICSAGDQLSASEPYQNSQPRILLSHLSSDAGVAVVCWEESVHLLFSTSRQIRPSLSTFGWKILVRKRILGGVMG